MNKDDKNYNWWKDPVNKELAEKLSWWDKPENQTTIELPVAIVFNGEQYTISTFHPNEEKYLGKELHGSASGETKEIAIDRMFHSIRCTNRMWKTMALKHQRWVPLIIGPWKKIGGKWITIFGFHFNFRYGSKMKHGWYIPFTKLNIMFVNKWKTYKMWKNEQPR